jgi:uncharacterized protein (TIGR02246 family)
MIGDSANEGVNLSIAHRGIEDGERIVAAVVGGLENAWNAADGDRFARPFADDADFVNIRGQHVRTRDAIAKGHHGIFNTIYKGSIVRYQVTACAR